jgi:hypothetical protein
VPKHKIIEIIGFDFYIMRGEFICLQLILVYKYYQGFPMKGELDELLEIVKYLIFVVVKINFIFKKQFSHIADKINLILYGKFFYVGKYG